MLVLGILAAVASSCLYNLSIAMQALQAREVSPEHGMRPSLLVRLVRDPRWLGATGIGLLGWPLELAALLMAPLTVVQPVLASGLLLLLYLGATRLGEPPGPRELVAIGAILVGLTGVALAAPERTTEHASSAALAVSLGAIALVALLPYLLRGRIGAAAFIVVVSAGCGYAWTGIVSKLVTDEVAAGSVAIAIFWLATLAGSEFVALLSEMSALQRRPATHVAPPMFTVQVLIPVLLAPFLFRESWGDTPLGGIVLGASIALAVAGTALVAASPAVAGVLENAAERERAAPGRGNGAR
jgi:drug/metabolite transporter (DMT)-like permease